MGDATSGSEPPPPPGEHLSGWTINWTGLVALVAIVAVGLVMWQWVGGSADDPGADDRADEVVSESSTPVATAEVVPATTTTTTRSAPTTAEPTTTTTVTPERQVIISGEMKPCRYGANCLVASFTIAGFDPHPGRFICIYPNSTRDFTFQNDGVEEACLTADQGDTIAIEVDGVRSASISESDLDGA